MILQPTLTGDYIALFFWGIGGMVLLSLSLIAFFVVYQRKIFAQERLRDEATRIHQRELLATAVEVQETERKRIARDLHDDIGSLLTATRLYLRQLSGDVEAQRVEAIKDQSLSILDEMIHNARRISHDLLPPALDKFGLQAAAEDLCERMNSSGGLTVHFIDSTPSDLRLSAEAEIGLYRILQELLTNTLKHADATAVEVSLAAEAFCFSLSYADNGRGFDQSNTSAGLGFRNIESRLAVINGELTVRSKPGEGTHYRIEAPKTVYKHQ